MNLIILLLTGIACQPAEDTAAPWTAKGPILTHEAPAGALAGTALTISANATDEDGVSAVILSYKPDTADHWTDLELTADADTYSGTIPANFMLPGPMAYYFTGKDNSPYLTASYLPIRAEEEPFILNVPVAAQGLPFVETFEGAESAISLYDIGWSEHSEGFRAYPWEISSSRANSGAWSVGHQAGGQKTDPLIDWLISPALNLSGEQLVQVSWYEYGENPDLANHTLHLSTGSPDPADGDFTEVSVLGQATDHDWDRSKVIDVSEYSDNAVVYFAWRYEGQFSDAWYIDDVTVQQLTADLALVDYSWTVAGPGEHMTLTLDIENKTTETAPKVSLSATSDGATSDGDKNIGDILGLSSTSADIGLTVDLKYPDNAYLPVTVTATSGAEIWEWDLSLVVGEQSLAEVTLTTDVLGYLDVTMGTGDPSKPILTYPLTTEIIDPGTYTYTIDLTDAHESLPPAAGSERWWLSIDSTSSGTLDSFTVSHDGQSFSANPDSFVGESSNLFYLPPPPEFSISSTTTNPNPVTPGSTVAVSWIMENSGSSTIGATTATLVSDDPDVTIISTPDAYITDTWEQNESFSLNFVIEIAHGHTNSRPVALSIEIDDEAETVATPIELNVPWPVLEIESLIIDDHDNELLDENENTDIEISLINSGDLDTVGAVDCTLSYVSGSATADIDQAFGSFGTLNVGETDDDDDFEITVTAGTLGDNLDLQLYCADDTNTYTIDVPIEIGAAPYSWITTNLDPIGDVLSDYPFDIVGGTYAADGTTIDIILESADPFDPATAFVEAWMLSDGASYTWYQLVAQSGVGSFRGYDDGVFISISNPTITAVDETHMKISVDITDAGLIVDTMSAGFAAGFCIDNYYCDHFPDNWGDPYVTGMTTTSWFELSW
jgi:hypothetical protein